MNQIKKVILVLSMICVVLIGFTPSVYADDEQVNECGPINMYECLSSGKKADYNLDTVPDSFAEEKDWKDKVNEWIPALGKLDEFVGKLNPLSHIPPLFNGIANIAFKLNILYTKATLTIMDFTFDFEIVNILIDKSASKIRTVSGISTDFEISGGLFGSFLQIIVLTSAVYGLFMIIFKRSILGSFETIFKTLIVITLSMLLFANYSSFLKSANKITTEASELILGADMGTKKDDDEKNDGKTVDLNKDTIRSDMKGNIWHMFVDRPYLYMMFGETSFEKNGIKDRFEAVTKHNSGSDGRRDALTKEANHPDDEGYGNPSILHSNVESRLAFTPIYVGLNIFVSIPIIILLVSLIIFQFWFLIMALFAPFALIVAAVPGQFNVLKRYGIELAYPLLAKLGVSFMLLMLFFVSDIIFTIDQALMENTAVKTVFYADPIGMYIVMGILNLLLFGIFFILRKRLQDILTSGSQALKDFKENQGNPFSQSFKKGVQTTAMVGGAVAGGIYGGAAGATMGANIGRTAGGVVTGEAGAEDVANTAMQAQRTHEFAQLRKEGEVRAEQQEVKEQERLQQEELVTQNVETAKAEPLANLNSSDMKTIYNNMNEEEREEIRVAGRNFEDIENLKQQPLSSMENVDYADLQNSSEFKTPNDKQEETPLEELSFNEMSSEQKYQVLKDNGTFGKGATQTTQTEREPINIQDLDYKEMLTSDISSYSKNEIEQISERLPEEKQEIFVNNMNHAMLEDVKGKTVHDLTVPLEPPNTIDENTDDSYEDSPYHTRDE